VELLDYLFRPDRSDGVDDVGIGELFSEIQLVDLGFDIISKGCGETDYKRTLDQSVHQFFASKLYPVDDFNTRTAVFDDGPYGVDKPGADEQSQAFLPDFDFS